MRQTPHNKKMTDQLEKEIVSLYLDGLSAASILKTINVDFKTTKTIYDILKKHEVIARDSETAKDPGLRHDYFKSIDTPEQAYLLGLMISDGWVVNPQRDSSGNIIRNAQIAFSLTESDLETVEWVKDQWNTSNKISTIIKPPSTFPNGKTYSSQPVTRVVVTSQIMFQDLNTLGVDARKSYVSLLPIVELDLYSHLLRGIIDGDGTIGLYKYGNKNLPAIKFLGSQCLMGQISWFLTHHVGLGYVKPSGKEKQSLSTITYNRINEVKKLYEYLYNNDCKSLKRKKIYLEDYFS